MKNSSISGVQVAVVLGIMSICSLSGAKEVRTEDLCKGLGPRAANDLEITLALANPKEAGNTVKPGKPISLQVTFRNKGRTAMWIYLPVVWRAGNFELLDPAGKAASSMLLVRYRWTPSDRDFTLLRPAEKMPITLEGEVARRAVPREGYTVTVLAFHDVGYVISGNGRYTLHYALRRDRADRMKRRPRFTFTGREWTGCAVSNPLEIDVQREQAAME